MERPWRFDLRLDREGGVPQRVQLIRALLREIRRGRLPPGATLPGSRTLAQQLAVNRKVVVSAIDELVAQGWLETRPAAGTRVVESLPRLAVADTEIVSEDSHADSEPSGSPLTISDGVPDPRLLPGEELARAYRRALLAMRRQATGYVDPAGDYVFRQMLVGFVNQARGLSARVDELFLTRGSQGALSLFSLAVLNTGDWVATEAPGYTPAAGAFGLRGARVFHLPVDGSGLITDELRKLAQRAKGKLKAVYITPHHQYPTTVPLAPERRMDLLDLAEQFGFYVIEDDYDYEYQFEGQPLLPLAATDPSRVLYVASFSKLLAPSIRLGYVVAPAECIERMRQVRSVLDRQGDPILERAVGELIEDGTLQRHARRANREYERRRDHLVAELRGEPALARRLDFAVPTGGLALWVRLRRGRVESLVRRARDHGLWLTPGSAHLPEGTLPAFRFGFAGHDPQELSHICNTLKDCFDLR